MSRLVLITTTYDTDRQQSYVTLRLDQPSDAPNVFQWAFAKGLHEAGSGTMIRLNALPCGTWPKAFRKLFLSDRDWRWKGDPAHEVGGINLPFVKQWMRYRKALRWMNQNLQDGDELLFLSDYLPFMKALCDCQKKVKATVLIADLPEYADLNETGRLRQYLRKRYSEMAHEAYGRADRFILLTEPMRRAVNAGSRPCLIVEGIYGGTFDTPKPPKDGKHIIFYSGTLFRQFGIGDLLKAFTLLDDPDAELWLCGSGEAEAEIRALAETDSRVHFFGFCSQKKVSELRSQACVLVNPRTNQGEYTRYSFPSKTMEYLSSGKPTVMYPLSGMPTEYLPHIIPVEGEGAESLCTALKKALAMTQSQRDAFGSSAADFIRQNKTAEKVGKRVLDFIHGN